MTEFELIYRYFEQHEDLVANNAIAPIIKSLGDDAAVVNIDAGIQWVTCVDTLVQGRHFSADWTQISELAFAIGFKAVAVNVSDVIAMGATPHSILLALSLPERLAHEQWLGEFAKGLFHACRQFGVRLIGGDTTRHGNLVISVTANGVMSKTQNPIYRSGAQVGDKVYVTGTLGDASYALNHLDNKVGQQLAHRLHMPTPRVALAQALVNEDKHTRPTAMIDVSDGLVQDLGHICTQSGVKVRLDLEKIPASQLLQSMALAERLPYQLTGGDDYELLFTLPSSVSIDAISNTSDTQITCIGEVTATRLVTTQSNNKSEGLAGELNLPVELFYNSTKVTKHTPFPFDRYPSLTGFQHFNA